MEIRIIGGVFTKIRRGKNGVDYATLEEGNSTISLSGGDFDLSKVALLEKVDVNGRVVGSMYNGSFSLKAIELDIKPTAGPKK